MIGYQCIIPSNGHLPYCFHTAVTYLLVQLMDIKNPYRMWFIWYICTYIDGDYAIVCGFHYCLFSCHKTDLTHKNQSLNLLTRWPTAAISRYPKLCMQWSAHPFLIYIALKTWPRKVRSHGWHQNGDPHLMAGVQLMIFLFFFICFFFSFSFLFVSWQSDHFFLRYSKSNQTFDLENSRSTSQRKSRLI